MNKRLSKFIIGTGLAYSALIFLGMPLLQAATITGSISVEGNVPQNPKLNMGADPVCQAFYTGDAFAEKVIVNKENKLKNVFVYIKEGLSGQWEAPKAVATLDQKGCRYEPHIMGVQAGQPLSILNSDATLHNVHALGEKILNLI